MSIFLDFVTIPIRFLHDLLGIEIGTFANGVFGIFVIFYYFMLVIVFLVLPFLLFLERVGGHVNSVVVTNPRKITVKRKATVQNKKSKHASGPVSNEVDCFKSELSKSQKEIKKYVEGRKIKTLTHFTQYKNIENILAYGLKTRSNLDELGMEYCFNDGMRLDNRENSISLSISYPNYVMLWKYSQKKHCVVLALDPSILWEYDCAFCDVNAAAKKIRDTPLEDLRGVNALNRMFDNPENSDEKGYRKGHAIMECDPTDEQAEVLVLNGIPVDKIVEIHFNPKNNDRKREFDFFNKSVTKTIEFKKSNIKIKLDKYFFQYRRNNR